MRQGTVLLAVALAGCMATNPPETQREKEERFIAEGQARLKIVEDLANYRRYKIGNERRRAFTEVLSEADAEYQRIRYSAAFEDASKRLRASIHRNLPKNASSDERRRSYEETYAALAEWDAARQATIDAKAAVDRLWDYRGGHLRIISIRRISDEARRTDERFEIDALAKQEYEKALIEARAIWKKGHD